MQQFAIEIARQAGEILKKHYNQPLEIKTKASNVDLVTQADIASEVFIIDAIQKTYPSHAILGEESGKSGDSDYVWVIDPLDGTTNFAHKHPAFSVAIALVHHQDIILGVTYDPLRDECFVAEKGQGATLNGKPISVSSIKKIERALVGTGFPYNRRDVPSPNVAEFSKIVPNVQGMRRLGSAALDFAYVACGRMDGYWEYSLNLWDWGGGALLVEEAGGIVTNMQGNAYTLKEKNLLIGNPQIHPQLLKMLHEKFA